MSHFDKLILVVCLLHPVFLSDVLDYVIGVVIGLRIVHTIQLPKQFYLGLIHVFFQGRKFGTLFMIHPVFLLYLTARTVI